MRTYFHNQIEVRTDSCICFCLEDTMIYDDEFTKVQKRVNDDITAWFNHNYNWKSIELLTSDLPIIDFDEIFPLPKEVQDKKPTTTKLGRRT